MSGKVRLVVPEAPVPATAAAKAQLQARAGAGCALGILDNSKGNADYLLKFIIDGVSGAGAGRLRRDIAQRQR